MAGSAHPVGSTSHAGYQPVKANSSEEVRHSPALERIAEKSFTTPWMLSNIPKLISAWDFTANIADLSENDTVEKTRIFMGLEKVEEDQKSFFMAFIEMILKWLGYDTSAKDLFLEKMQKDLDVGSCHGISLSLMRALVEAQKTNPKATIQDVIDKLSKDDIVLLQLLSNLRVEIYKQNRLRYQQLTAIISKKPVDGIPDEIKKEDREVLNAKMQQGRELLHKIDAEIKNLMGFEFTQEISIKDQGNEIEKFLNNPNQANAKFVISFYSPTTDLQDEPIAGHSIVLDLKNFAFFDINCGYYIFKSKEECIAALRARVAQDYQEYAGGVWKMRVVHAAVEPVQSGKKPQAAPAAPVAPAPKKHTMHDLAAASADFAATTAASSSAGRSDDTAIDPSKSKKPKGRLHFHNPFKRNTNKAVSPESDSE